MLANENKPICKILIRTFLFTVYLPYTPIIKILEAISLCRLKMCRSVCVARRVRKANEGAQARQVRLARRENRDRAAHRARRARRASAGPRARQGRGARRARVGSTASQARREAWAPGAASAGQATLAPRVQSAHQVPVHFAHIAEQQHFLS